ncbi:MAG: diguanylate cyclase [Methyloprofundus sp.]|nr:diguanylate cyclase [Methyloprofundus sp.]
MCVDQLNDAIVITEAEPFNLPGPRILWANKVFYDLTGYTPEELIGQTPRILQGPLSDRATLDKIRSALKAWQPIRAEILNYRKDGSVYWNEVQIVPIANDKGRFTHCVSIQRDVTARKAIEAELHQLAFYDPLTGLPNRRLMEDRLQQMIATSQRKQSYAAVMFLDLDNFKSLNDTHGHALGDLLLIEVAHRLKACVREVDTVARFAGDEFVVLLSELGEQHDIAHAQAGVIAEKIRSQLAQPYLLNSATEATQASITHICTSSIGVVTFINHEASINDLMKWADAAMYRAKAAGRNQICSEQCSVLCE